MKRWIFLIALGVLGALVVRKFVLEGVYVASPSMEPTLTVGTHFFVEKLTFQFRSPRRGEIILFDSPVKEGVGLIKRVIALPGETIAIQNKKVYVNGQPLKEDYVTFKRRDEILVGDNISDMKVMEDSYFVMGDNRDESGDSRDWKNKETGEHIYFVQKQNIKGRLMNVLE